MEQKFITVPFDLSKAKQITNGEIEGKIVTRDGRNARIICWDRNNETYPIVVLVPDEDGIEDSLSFTENGSYYEEGETKDDLLLQLPEYLTFKDGDVIAYGNFDNALNIAIFKEQMATTSHNGYASLGYHSNTITYYYNGHTLNNARFATEAEKQRLIKVLQASHDKRAVDCLKKLGVEVKPKCELKPFDKVLCRNNAVLKWEVDIFRHIIENPDCVYKYSCMCDTWKHCIPYEGNEHLLGTNKSSEE